MRLDGLLSGSGDGSLNGNLKEKRQGNNNANGNQAR